MTEQEERIIALEAEVNALKGVVAQLADALAAKQPQYVPMPHVPPANPLPFLPGPTWRPTWVEPPPFYPTIICEADGSRVQ